MKIAALFLFVLGCASPEATRARGGGPGADVGNRGATLDIHGRVDMFHDTPRRLQVTRR